VSWRSTSRAAAALDPRGQHTAVGRQPEAREGDSGSPSHSLDFGALLRSGKNRIDDNGLPGGKPPGRAPGEFGVDRRIGLGGVGRGG